jgi:hypothetical protein
MVYFRTYGPHPEVYSFNSATGQPGVIIPALVQSGD